MPRFRKVPIEVEAIQYLGPKEEGHDVTAIQQFGAIVEPHPGWNENYTLMLWTAKSQQYNELKVGDWVIKEQDNSGYYPCDGDVFTRTYEEV